MDFQTGDKIFSVNCGAHVCRGSFSLGPTRTGSITAQSGVTDLLFKEFIVVDTGSQRLALLIPIHK